MYENYNQISINKGAVRFYVIRVSGNGYSWSRVCSDAIIDDYCNNSRSIASVEDINYFFFLRPELQSRFFFFFFFLMCVESRMLQNPKKGIIVYLHKFMATTIIISLLLCVCGWHDCYSKAFNECPAAGYW